MSRNRPTTNPRRLPRLAAAATLAVALTLVSTGCYTRTIRAEGITAPYTHNKRQQPQTTIDQDIARGVRGWFNNEPEQPGTYPNRND